MKIIRAQLYYENLTEKDIEKHIKKFTNSILNIKCRCEWYSKNKNGKEVQGFEVIIEYPTFKECEFYYKEFKNKAKLFYKDKLIEHYKIKSETIF